MKGLTMKKSVIIFILIIFLSSASYAYIENQFVDNGNGTITDNATGLTWRQGTDGTMNWQGALSFCEDLDYAGYTDWRLPDVKELRSIVDNSKVSPAINTTFFPGTQSSYYWTSTTYAGSTSYAWHVTFFNGYVYDSNKSSSNYVRCVRG